jgi:hypothetical protein
MRGAGESLRVLKDQEEYLLDVCVYVAAAEERRDAGILWVNCVTIE